MRKVAHKYLRHDKKFPHLWCPGCGHGIILGAIVRAISKLGWKKNNIAMVSGIGCSSRTPVYVDFNTVHTIHGRALAFATGIKMSNPDLNVITVMGDGDAAAIGGNHLIHAARRNINITAIIFNNNIYGMTGGQLSPLTPMSMLASTAPYGHIEPSFDLVNLMIGAGASFVARATAYHVTLMEKLLIKAFDKKGFSVIDIISQCPTSFGRKNKLGDAVSMMEWQKERCVPINAYNKLTKEEKQEKLPIGVLSDRDLPEYTELYKNLIINKAMEKIEGE